MRRSLTTAAAVVDLKRTMASVLVLALGMVMMTFSVASAQSASSTADAAPSSLEKTVAYTQPSIVYLDITYTGWVVDRFNSDKNDKSYLNNAKPFVLKSSCTGFFVDDIGNIATAGHCVDPKEVTSAYLDAAASWAYTCRCYYSDKSLSYETIRGFADDDYVVEGSKTGVGSTSNYKKGADVQWQAVWSTDSTQPLYDAQGDLNGNPYPAHLVKFVPFDQGDVALLKVEVDNVVPLPVLDEKLDTGAQIVAVWLPGSGHGCLRRQPERPCRSSRERCRPFVPREAYPVYEMSTPMSGGMSGGPTVTVGGEVVGVNSYGVAGGVAQSFEFSQSSKTLVQLMTDAGVTPGLGEIGTAYRAGLDAFFAGDKEAAVTNLEEAVSLNSDFAMADEFLAEAEDMPDPVVAEDSSSSLPMVLGIGLLLVVLAAAGFLVMRNRKPVAQPAAAASVAKPATEPVRPTPAAPVMETAPMPDAQTDELPVFCTRCGQEISDKDAAFCGKCGAPGC